MVQLAVILVGVLVLGAVGVLIFLPWRWLVLRRLPPEQKQNATGKDFITAIAIVVPLLFLAWLMEAGNSYAVMIWSWAGLVVSVAGAIYLSKRRRRVELQRGSGSGGSDDG